MLGESEAGDARLATLLAVWSDLDEPGRETLLRVAGGLRLTHGADRRGAGGRHGTAPAAQGARLLYRPLCPEERELLQSMPPIDRRRWLARRRERQRQWVVQDALRDMLVEYHWEWFGHLTFETCLRLDYAKRAVGRWFNLLSRRAWGRNYWKRTNEGLYAFAAFERQKRGDWHSHFLAGGTREMRRLDAMDAWQRRHGFARIYAYDAERGGAAYAVKYATKETDGDYSLIGHLRGNETLPLFRSHGKA